ncbi:MAG: hypothetical protein WCD78_17555 [Pseudolabrys sp.]
MRLYSIDTTARSGVSGQIWQYLYFRLLGEAFGFTFSCARVGFAHFDLSHLLNLPGAVDVTLNPFDDSFEPISFTEAFACLDDPDKLRDKERISIVFDYNYWRQFAAFDAKITNYLASDADLQSRVTAIVATMRESARIGNPITASDPYTIVVHARIGEQFKFKLKYSWLYTIAKSKILSFILLPCLPAMRCLDKQSCAKLRDYIDALLDSLQDQRASSLQPSRVVLFSDGLWCIEDTFHNPMLAKYLNRCYLDDVKSAVDESYVDYTSASSELAIRYFAHCDLLLHGLGGFAPTIFHMYNRKANSRLAQFAGRRWGAGTLLRLVESSRILR